MRTPVTRVGNKTALLGIICPKFPLSYKKFVDVFGGSGSVLLGKPEIAPFEVYNDLDRNLVNLFRCMKHRTMALIRELGFCNLNARDDFRVITKFFQHETFDDQFMEEEMQLTSIMLPEPQSSELWEMRKRIIMDYDVRRAAMSATTRLAREMIVVVRLATQCISLTRWSRMSSTRSSVR